MANRWKRVAGVICLSLAVSIIKCNLPPNGIPIAPIFDAKKQTVISQAVMTAATYPVVYQDFKPVQPNGRIFVVEVGPIAVYTCAIANNSCTVFINQDDLKYKALCIYPKDSPSERSCMYFDNLTVKTASKRRAVSHE